MEFIFFIAVLVCSVVLHEVSHGVVANILGDPTAKNAGRLTMNPIPHIDPVGSLLLPGVLIAMSQLTGGGIILGWAKPVPINPANFKRPKRDSILVSLAGPASNFALAIAFGLALRFLPLEMLNVNLAYIFGYIVLLNISLGVFNLLPIPPLDGSHVLLSLLPRSLEAVRRFLYQYGLFVLLFFLFFLSPVISFFVRALFSLIVGA
ncbi:MAG: site-2 protease family protein [Candidatus Wildermuthbacteria bacterium]|nr:site-2 protease family protein [Candidatus Wildermuthbacteria bacterium]